MKIKQSYEKFILQLFLIVLLLFMIILLFLTSKINFYGKKQAF